MSSKGGALCEQHVRIAHDSDDALLLPPNSAHAISPASEVGNLLQSLRIARSFVSFRDRNGAAEKCSLSR